MKSIAIDGPAGAGKTTLAKHLAQELGFHYVDTGAIYRTIAYHFAMYGIGPKDKDTIARLIGDANIDITYDEQGAQHMILNGTDVTSEIRTPEISTAASVISAQPLVRNYLLDMQRSMARKYDVVMDGRDIGTVVLPHADVKLFVTASEEIRAQRRFLELQEKGEKTTLEQVLQDQKARDLADSTRAVAPLKQAEDAILLDTSCMTPEEACAKAKAIVEGAL